MKELLLAKLRDRRTNISEFRWATQQLAHILASEAAVVLPKTDKIISTPMGTFEGIGLDNKIVLVPIFRSGLAMVPGFLEFFPMANIGCIGMKRDEETQKANLYYKNLPDIGAQDRVLLLDPMIATGGSGADAINILLEHGVEEDKITFVAVIGSRMGVEKVNRAFPKIKLIIPAIDEELNPQGFIVPGLGDFGDRYFGTL